MLAYNLPLPYIPPLKYFSFDFLMSYNSLILISFIKSVPKYPTLDKFIILASVLSKISNNKKVSKTCPVKLP